MKIEICRTIVLPLSLYGCETWFPQLRDKHRLRAFENRVLRKIFGCNREEVTGWRKWHNEELHNLCSSLNIIREDAMDLACIVHERYEKVIQNVSQKT
jgi:hypothetical protein